MEEVKIEEILKWSGGLLAGRCKKSVGINGVSIDSRTVKKGQLFLALKGQNFDGHNFVNEAFKKGAAAAVVNRNFDVRGNGCFILTQDTMKALGDIAKGYRSKFKVKVVGITGSDGKTTTKEVIKRVLSSGYNVVGTEGNFNNQIGLPLTLLNINRRSDFCVVEMGMNKKGEIDYLSKIAFPSTGVITNVGYAHIGFFKNTREIAECKGELLNNLKDGKLAILNYDTPFFTFFKKIAQGKIISFGLKKGSDFHGVIEKETGTSFSFSVEGLKEEFVMNFWNPSLFYSGIIGVLFGVKFGIPLSKVKNIIDSFKPIPGRGKMHYLEGIKVIDESYNSNPNSLKWALYYFSRKISERKIAIIGDMAELGKYSFIFHYNIGRFLDTLPIDIILTFGKHSKSIGKGIVAKNKSRIKHFVEIAQLKKYLKKNIKKGDMILIKGSRIMQLERILDFFKSS